MEYRRLGNTGLEISVIGLGTNNFGGRSDFDESKAVLNQCLESGVNFLDTANAYSAGKSEEIIGEVISKGGHRQDMIIATKVGLNVSGGPPGTPPSKPNMGGSSRLHIMNEVEKSLRRLQTDYIDVYYMHRWDANTPMEETLRTLDDLVHQGKVRYVGASNYTAWQLAEAIHTSRTQGLYEFSCLQVEYSMLVRDVEAEAVPFSEKYNVGIIPFFPLAGGFLTGKYSQGTDPAEGTRFAKTPMFKDRYMSDKNWDVLGKVGSFAGERGHSTAELAFAWLLANPTIPSVIAGATKPEQVEANAKAAEWKLTADEVAEVTALLG